jgi:hypothetical protein
MAWTLLISFISLTLAFVWMLLVRYRIGVLQDWLGRGELDVALLERQAEGSPAGPVTVGPAPADPDPVGAGLLAGDAHPERLTTPDHTVVPGGFR